MENISKHASSHTDADIAGMFLGYLDTMMESPSKAHLDLSSVPPEWQDFAKGLLHVDECLTQAHRELKNTYEMVSALAVESTSFIIFFDGETKGKVFANDIAETYLLDHPHVSDELIWTLKHCSDEVYEHSIHWKCRFSDENDEHPAVRLTVASHCITWNDRRVVAHLIVDDTEDMEDETTMQELAYHDPLTGLFNRRYGMKEANRLMKAGKPFCLAFIDLDNLKFCNDTFGHNKGDEYIVKAADMMRTIPQPRMICRIGGDEFLVVAEGQTRLDMLKHLQGMNRTLLLESAEANPGHFRTLSYGIVDVPANSETLLTSYLERADAIMYTRKQRHKAYLEAKAPVVGNRHVLDTTHRRHMQV